MRFSEVVFWSREDRGRGRRGGRDGDSASERQGLEEMVPEAGVCEDRERRRV